MRNEEQRSIRPRKDIRTELQETIDVTEEVTYTTKTKTGIVTGCTKLNVRQEPNTDCSVVCIIDESSTVIIDDQDSITDWYKVCAENGAEGYCMKKFISVES